MGRIIEKVDFTLEVPAVNYKKTITLVVKEKCFCNRDIEADELREMIIQIRKQSYSILQKQYIKDLGKNIQIADMHKKNKKYGDNPVYVYENQFVIKYEKEYFSLDTGKKVEVRGKPNFYMKEKNDYTDFQDNLFQNNIKDRFLLNPLSYDTFVVYLNQTFNTYDIKTCLQKIHFLAQCYVETFRFTKTYEDSASNNYQGGEVFRGRGFIHLTHDYNYLEYYDKIYSTNFFHNYIKNRTHKLVNGKTVYEKLEDFNIRTKNKYMSSSDIEKLEKFAKKISTDLFFALDSAGWYWQRGKINQYADKDNVEDVTKAITGSSQQALEERKKYTKMFKKVFDYENCEKK